MNDLPVGRSVDETLRLVQAFQYTDRHGEVCPAGWKPGQDTVSFQINNNKVERCTNKNNFNQIFVKRKNYYYMF